MRQFDINNPWTKIEMEKDKKETKIDLILVLILFPAIISVSVIMPVPNNIGYYISKILLILFEICCMFIVAFALFDDIKEKYISSEQYKKLINFAEKNPKINNYIDRVKKKEKLSKLILLCY